MLAWINLIYFHPKTFVLCPLWYFLITYLLLMLTNLSVIIFITLWNFLFFLNKNCICTFPITRYIHIYKWSIKYLDLFHLVLDTLIISILRYTYWLLVNLFWNMSLEPLSFSFVTISISVVVISPSSLNEPILLS